MNNIIFISAFTSRSIYQKLVEENLIPFFKKYQLQHHIFEYKDQGNWAANSRHRPILIKEAMIKYPNHNIVWIDADAKILEVPVLFYTLDAEIQISCHMLNWKLHYGRPSDEGKTEILDGTCYYKNSPEMLEFVDEWIKRSTLSGKNHRLMMGEMIKEKKLNFFDLPREYCYIVNKPNGDKPAVPIENPIITHHQASRLARKI